MNKFNNFSIALLCTSALFLASPSFGHAQFSQAPAPVTGAKAAAITPTQTGLQSAARLLQQGQALGAVQVLRPLVNTGAETLRAQARYLLALALDATGDPTQALQVLEGTLTEASPLGKAIGQLRGQLMLQAAEKAFMGGQTERTAGLLADYERLSVQPDKTRFKRLQYMLSPPAALATAAPLRVGVILPQTGALGGAGTDLLRALQLGLPAFTTGGRKVELVVQDATTPAEAATAATFLKAQQVSIILGPLLANQVGAVAAKINGLPLLTFSSDGTVLGPQIHTLNFLPEQQAAQAATAAIGQGATNFAALVPQGAYGEATLNGLRKAVEANGATLGKTSFYNPNETDIGSSIRELGQGFNALLLPAQGRNLPLIAAQLAYYGLDRGVQLLGTALWQAPETQAAVLAPSASALRGGLFAAPSRNGAFAEDFTQTYGAAPHPLAALGYDAAALLAQLATEQTRSGNAVSQILLRPEGFYAPGGYAKFTTNGQTARSLSVAEVGGGTNTGQFTERQPALTLAPLPLPTPLLPEAGARAWW